MSEDPTSESRSDPSTGVPDERALTDGGAVDDVALDPWGSSTVENYRKLFEQFGIEEFDEVLGEVADPHYLMRRGVIFGHRDYRDVARAMREQEDAAVLSGFMPTGDPHIGHKMVFDEIIWHQEHGADAYGLIADMEAHAARGLSWDEIDEHTESYLLSLLALGFDPKEGEIYRQSTNREVQDLGFELGTKANFSELQAIYDFDGETNVSYMQSVVTQMADILYPQLEGPRPTVIPVGPDQDPHVRLARDLAARMRYFKVTEAYASFEADPAERELVAAAYEALGGADADIRCEDAAEWLSDQTEPEGAPVASTVEKLENAGKEPVRPRVRFLAREVEVENGGYGFYPPTSVYHRFMTGLTGGKMSSSVPASHISLLDDPEDGYDKVKSATTGGRETAEKQRELGGEADECPVYELYAYLLAQDDDEYTKRVYEECVGGERLCGGCKEEAAELMREFLADHQEKREEAKELLDSLDVELESPRK